MNAVFLIETCSDQNNAATALSYHIHTNSYSRTLTMDALSLCVIMSSVDTVTEHQLLCEYYLTAEKCYITLLPLAIKCLHLRLRHSDSCTSCSRHISNSTSAGVTRMQVAKAVIASVLILTVCARLPEGKDCAILKCGTISVVRVLTICVT